LELLNLVTEVNGIPDIVEPKQKSVPVFYPLLMRYRAFARAILSVRLERC